MDPLSAAASLAETISLTIELAGSIANVCGIYIDQGSHSSQEITLLQQQVTSLRLVLEKLRDKTTDLSIFWELTSAVTNCPSNLTALKEKIDPGREPDVESKIQWPLTRDELDNAIRDIQIYTSLFNVASSVDQPKLRSPEHLEKLPVANGAEFDSFMNQYEDDYTIDKQTELLQQIIEWAESPQGKYIFWLRGCAGTGKSTISRMAAKHFQRKGMLGASYFFQHGSIDRRNATRVFTTIAKQLAVNVPFLIPGVSQAVALDPDISTKSPKLQFDQLLLQPLLSLEQDRRTTTKVLVIDGLDECDNVQEDIPTILHLLSQLQRSTCVPIRIFLTSRPDSTISHALQKLSNYEEADLRERVIERLRHKIAERLNKIQLSKNMESDAFKKVQKDLEKFVFPDLEEVPLIEPEIANEHHPAPSYPITTSALGISSGFARRSQSGWNYYLNLQRLLSHVGFQESSIPQHHRRLRWTNRRGEKFYDDYIEHEPGALRIMQNYLDKSVEGAKTTSAGGQDHASARPTSSHMSIPTSTWANNTGATNRADESLQSPEGVRNSLHEKDVELGEPSSRTLRLMSCIERRGYPVKLHQEVVSHIKDDRELFHALRRIYHDHKGRFEPYWSLRTVQAIHFMKFTYAGHPYIDVRCHDELCEKGKPCHCIPPPRLVHPMGTEYECCPVPAKLSPPVGPQLMMSLFNDPDSIQSAAALIMQQLPKRMSGKLCSQSFEQAEAWGIYYAEEWNWAKIWLVLAVGFFFPSLVFGVLWSILKMDVQGAFGIASWWMTGATIILGVIGTCS